MAARPRGVRLYNTFTWWHTASGQARAGRPASYDFPTYLPDYARVSQALSHVPLAGAADSEQVTRHRGAYTLELGAGSAAMLTVRVRG